MAKILIVDDHSETRLLLNQILAKEGYQVIEAEDGRSACEKAVSEKPDLVLLDVMMPGVSGFEVIEMLKEAPATQGIPVIMLTAYDGREDMMRGMKSPALANSLSFQFGVIYTIPFFWVCIPWQRIASRPAPIHRVPGAFRHRAAGTQEVQNPTAYGAPLVSHLPSERVSVLRVVWVAHLDRNSLARPELLSGA